MRRTRLVSGLAMLFALVAALTFLGNGVRAEGAPLVGSIVLALALVGVGLGTWLGKLTLRDPFREWAMSRDAALVLGGLATILAFLAHAFAGMGFAAGFALGYLGRRDPGRASDVAFACVALAVLSAVTFRAKEWQESALYFLPAILLAMAYAARESWDLASIGSPDAGSRAALRHAFLRFAAPLAAAVLAAIALGAWIKAGAHPPFTPGAGLRGVLLAVVLAGSAGAMWLVARRARTP